MNLGDVMDEIGSALGTIGGLRVQPYWANKITPPAASVAWPDDYTYDQTFGRGSDRMTLPVTVLVGKVDARSSRDDLARFVDGAGSSSVKAAVEGFTYTACDTTTVKSVQFEVVSVAAIDYLAATFSIEIFGSGN